MVQLFDALTLDAPRRTRDGFLAVRAKAARAGTYQYLGQEVDPTGSRFKANDTVTVYRPSDEVFDRASIASFIGKPVTNDHPTVAVTADNWKAHSRGAVMGAVRDGEYLAFDLTIMDGEAIQAIDGGKRELSNGYACDLSFEDGVAPDGTKYQAVQRNIRGNHVALVDKGRAGSECVIRDNEIRFALCDANLAVLDGFTPEKPMKTFTLDGLPVNLGDEAAVEAAFAKLVATADKAKADLADAQTQISTLTGEKAGLEKSLADANAKLTPEAINARVADRAKLIADAKRILPTLAADALDEAGIRRAVVTGKLGDAAKDMDDAAIAGAFVALTADAPTAAQPEVVNIKPAAVADSATVRDAVRGARYN
jgi:hypothetical protein